ncbi:MAG: EAL domain-containing response regulator [Nevskiaceae bacterium]
MFTSVRAFVVEDHAFQREGLVTLLRAIGVRHVGEAANGREALAKLEAERGGAPADVILCDLEMPEMDGIEFLRAVAERRLARGVIIISGREQEILEGVETMVRASGLTVMGRLSKPVSAAALWDVMGSEPEADPAAATAIATADPTELRRGLEAREFRCEFQPKVRLATREIVGVEALARWQRTDGTPVGPTDFVPAMVRAGLIGLLTEQMLDAACGALKAWDRLGLTLTAAVNVSMFDLSDVGTTDRLAAKVGAGGVPPARITLEVTETEVMSDVAAVLNVLTRLRLKGFRLAIDDFGTGYASLAQLNTIPFTELKIDQTFVRNCGQSRRLRNIVQLSIDLARRLDIHTVAEGIETLEEWDFLRLAACDEGQGHYVAHPMPADEIPSWADRWTVRSRHAG